MVCFFQKSGDSDGMCKAVCDASRKTRCRNPRSSNQMVLLCNKQRREQVPQRDQPWKLTTHSCSQSLMPCVPGSPRIWPERKSVSVEETADTEEYDRQLSLGSLTT